MPFVKPMLAGNFAGRLPRRFFVQPKLDGVRAIAARDGLWSRSGRRNRSCSHIEVPKIKFHVFDTVAGEPFSLRTAVVQQVRSAFSNPSSSIDFVETTHASSRGELDRQFQDALSDGYEGLIIRADAPYVHGRSSNLLKLKPFVDAEFPVVGIEEVRGALSGFAQRVTLQLADGRTFKAGLKCKRAHARTILNGNFKTATVRFSGLTPNGIPRSAVAVAFS